MRCETQTRALREKNPGDKPGSDIWVLSRRLRLPKSEWFEARVSLDRFGDSLGKAAHSPAGRLSSPRVPRWLLWPRHRLRSRPFARCRQRRGQVNFLMDPPRHNFSPVLSHLPDTDG